MDLFTDRTRRLIGEDACQKLHNAHVAIFGIGGVGSFSAEAIARAGVGKITLVDADRVSPTNLNRQLVALRSTIGLLKTDVMRDRIADINPDAVVTCHPVFFDATTFEEFPFSDYDYIIDAIDSVTSKLLLIRVAKENNIPILCSMGTGNKLHPDQFKIADIQKTSVCPLARVIRREIKKYGIQHLKVLYSEEVPITPAPETAEEETVVKKRSSPASISFVPSVAGLTIAGEVIRDLTDLT